MKKLIVIILTIALLSAVAVLPAMAETRQGGPMGGQPQMGGMGPMNDQRGGFGPMNNRQPNDAQAPADGERPELPDDAQAPADGERPELPDDAQAPADGERPELPDDAQAPADGERPELPDDAQAPTDGERPELPDDAQAPTDGERPELPDDAQAPADGEQSPDDNEMPVQPRSQKGKGGNFSGMGQKPMGGMRGESRNRIDFDALVKSEVISQQTCDNIKAFMRQHAPAGLSEQAPAEGERPELPDGAQAPTDGEAPDLLTDLLENGVITQAEYDAITASMTSASAAV